MVNNLLNTVEQMRKLKGFKAIEVANASEISKNYYSELVNGRKQGLTVKQLHKMADFVGLELCFKLKNEALQGDEGEIKA